MTRLRRTTAAAIASLGLVALLATPSLAADEPGAETTTTPEQLAHMGYYRGGGYAGQPCPWGMMGWGMGHRGTGRHGMMGPGMMGPGMGRHGMMGRGMMGPGMGRHGMTGRHGIMGHGMMRPGFGATIFPSMHLTTDDVRHFLEHHLAMQGNPRLKVGEIKQADDDSIVADIVTAEGSLVDRFRIDRHNGRMQRVN